MKRIFILVFISLFCVKMSAQGLKTAREFGEYMRQWIITEDDDFEKKIANICDGKSNGEKISTRIADAVSQALAPRHNYPQKSSYELNSYLNWIENEIDRGGFSCDFSDYEIVDRNRIEGTTTQETKYAREEDKEYVSCRVKVKGNGALSLDVYDLICMRDGKITLISKFEKVGNKVKVDFSDLVDEHSLEVSYGYSSRFPMNIGISTNFSYFNIGVEYGMNFSDEQIDFKKHTNYATSSLERGKYWYLMATPGVYLRYASVDCGLGNVFAKYNYNYESVYTSSTTSEKKNYFIMKPKVTFHIPIPFGVSPREEVLYISPHVGYQYVPKCSALNCWEVGIGVRFRFETY